MFCLGLFIFQAEHGIVRSVEVQGPGIESVFLSEKLIRFVKDHPAVQVEEVVQSVERFVSERLAAVQLGPNSLSFGAVEK